MCSQTVLGARVCQSPPMLGTMRRVLILVLITATAATAARAQDAVNVEVAIPDNLEDIEKRYTPELEEELHSVKADALLLYTEFSAKAGTDMKSFISNVTAITKDTKRSIDREVLYNGPDNCRIQLEKRLQKVENDAHRAATFSGDNHHKFLLGHMIVFRMHINKSEDYINKCDKAIKGCGVACEMTPRVKRLRRLALDEIHRVRDDIQHSRRSYRDIITHARRRLTHLKKEVLSRTREAIEEFEQCVREG